MEVAFNITTSIGICNSYASKKIDSQKITNELLNILTNITSKAKFI